MARLGAGPPGSSNDYKALKSHQFFKGVAFDKLNSIKIELDHKPPEEVVPPPQSSAESSESTLQRQHSWGNKSLVHEGELKKRNPYFLNQARHFKLYSDGRLEYFKDKTDHRGTI